MRQDTAFHDGEAISQKADRPAASRGIVDRVITVDAHLHRTADIRRVFPGIEADNLSAMPAIASSAAQHRDRSRHGRCRSGCGVAPLGQRSRGPARACAYVIAQKIRRGDRSVEIGFAEAGLVAGRPVLLVDDIVSSGGTLIACARALTAAGATTVDAVVTHALFAPGMAAGFATTAGDTLRPFDIQRAASHQCDSAR